MISPHKFMLYAHVNIVGWGAWKEFLAKMQSLWNRNKIRSNEAGNQYNGNDRGDCLRWMAKICAEVGVAGLHSFSTPWPADGKTALPNTTKFYKTPERERLFTTLTRWFRKSVCRSRYEFYKECFRRGKRMAISTIFGAIGRIIAS